MLTRIISGGQTGVDRAALDAAQNCGIETGGWCPRGRRAEDGPIPETYPLLETDSHAYDVRTKRNVRESDGTLILHASPLTGGTLLTARCADEQEKPCCCLNLADLEFQDAAELLQRWLKEERIGELNVAGPRESTTPGIYETALDFLTKFFQQTT